MHKRTLIIDGQIFQTDALDRGMGRYSACLIKSIIEEKKYDKIKIIINKNSKIDHKILIKSMFTDADIVELGLFDTSRHKIENATSVNKKILNTFISETKKNNNDIDFLILSPFQEPAVSVFPDGVKKIIIFYDLIPFLYYQRYQSLMAFEDYLKRFKLIIEADLLLTISKSVRDDLMVYLGIPRERIKSIDGAAIRSGGPQEKPSSFDVPENFILMPTSDDPRKNNLRAVLGFEEFRVGRSDDLKLIITSKIHSDEQKRLTSFSKNLIFTGNIIESQLDWLYERCQAVLFIPESEGLGLPILEAVLHEKRVICSSLNVFKEISLDAFYFCDHENQSSIAEALAHALSPEPSVIPKREYDKIMSHYSWRRTAKRAIDAINGTKIRQVAKRPKVAIFIPSPSGLSAVGKVVAEAHPALIEHFDIDYYVESGRYLESTRPNYLKYISNYYSADTFSLDAYSKYDAVFYHIGNSDYHIESIRNSLYLPGFVILHDTNISEAYRIMFERNIISDDRRKLEEKMTDIDGSDTSRNINSVVNNQLGILTHSNYARDAVNEILLVNTPIRPVHLATNCPDMTKERDYKKITIGLAGIIADIKGIGVIESLAKNISFQDCDIKLFGYNYASQDTLIRLNSYANISVSTNLTDFNFQNNISKLDIFVNYRMKYQGETSLSTVEAMRQGVVVIVRNMGWYSELPDDAVIKVSSEEEVIKALLELKKDTNKLALISAKAKKFIQDNYGYDQYIEGMKWLIDINEKSHVPLKNISDKIKSGVIKNPSQLIELYSTQNLKEEC